jgi:hypothetical protein
VLANWSGKAPVLSKKYGLHNRGPCSPRVRDEKPSAICGMFILQAGTHSLHHSDCRTLFPPHLGRSVRSVLVQELSLVHYINTFSHVPPRFILPEPRSLYFSDPNVLLCPRYAHDRFS